MKIAVITCYAQPDYVRARTLRTAFAAAPETEVLVIRNRHTGWWRYFEVMLKVLAMRWRDKPDAYVITFRGYEMLLLMRLALVRRPIIFDEMVNFTEWLEEHQRLSANSRPYRLFRRWYGRLAGHARFILADTEAHAHYSAQLNRLERGRYRTVPIGTDETVFYPRKTAKAADDTFTVFYYGHMLPLHGLEYVLQAAVLLKDEKRIRFRLVGGKHHAKIAKLCAAAEAQGANLTHESWVPFDELPAAINGAGLTLGGPFGGTLQSQFVITGKTYQFLAMGVPVLIGRNQVNHLFEDRRNCLLAEQADAESIAGAIRWAHTHPKELAAIGKAGRQLYQEHFSQAVINRLVARLIKDL